MIREIRSNNRQSGILSAGILALGLLFVWLTRHAQVGDTNTLAAMWLGVLLMALGVVGLVFLVDVTVAVDPEQRQLLIEQRSWWSWLPGGRRQTILPFAEVASVHVVKIGTRANGLPSYWLQIQPRQGRRIHTGRWSLSEREMRELAAELVATVGCATSSDGPGGVGAITVWTVLGAAVGALLIYAVWYWVAVGAWCVAMWCGTAPPVILLLAFTVLLALLRRVVR